MTTGNARMVEAVYFVAAMGFACVGSWFFWATDLWQPGLSFAIAAFGCAIKADVTRKAMRDNPAPTKELT